MQYVPGCIHPSINVFVVCRVTCEREHNRSILLLNCLALHVPLSNLVHMLLTKRGFKVKCQLSN